MSFFILVNKNEDILKHFGLVVLIDPPPRPDHSPLFASICWPGQAGLTSAGSVAAGSDGCLLGRIHFPCGYVVYVLLCC